MVRTTAEAPAPPPDWDGARLKRGKLAWTCLGTTKPKAVAPGDTVKFKVEGLPTRGELLVLAVARCAEDPVNIEADTELPCALGAPMSTWWSATTISDYGPIGDRGVARSGYVVLVPAARS